MEQCSDQVTYQLPTPHTHVSHYLKGITSPDQYIRAGIASIHQDKTGMLINFEDTVAYLAPLCPVAKNRKETAKRPHGEIYDITGEADVRSTEMKKGTGKTGVELRCHKKAEFVLFSHEQQEELIACSTSNQTHNRGNNQSNINTNDRNGQSDKKRRKTEAKVQRR